MAFPPEFLLELKAKNDIESVISPYVELKRRGRNLVGLCPFHNEKTPSFTVYTEKGNYHCFGCSAGGDVITFVMQIENLDYPEAVRKLAERAGMQMPNDSYDGRAQQERKETYEINKEAARYFYSCLMSEAGKKGFEYLTGRGISVRTIRHFGLGFAPDGWSNLKDFLLKKGYTEKQMLTADLISKSQNGHTFDRFRNRVIYPIINISGKIIGFGGRALPGEDKKGAKYINTSDTPVFKKSLNMYALNFAKSACENSAILAEGYMDVIALHQAGFTNAVAALGTAFTTDQAKMLGRYTKEVIVTLDADEAGKKATDRAIHILEEQGIPARILRLPDCKDPDEFIKKHSAARFEAVLNGAVSDIEYRLYMAADGIDISSDDGKLQYLQKASDVLSKLDNSIAVDLYAGRLAAKYDVSKQAVLSAVKEKIAKKKKKTVRQDLVNIVAPKSSNNDVNPDKQKYYRAATAEEALMSTLIYHPEYCSVAADEISPDDFVTALGKRLYSKILEIHNKGITFDTCLLGEDFTPSEIGYVASLADKSVGDPKKMVKDSIDVIKQEKYKIDNINIAQLPDDQWAEKMKMIGKNKKGNK